MKRKLSEECKLYESDIQKEEKYNREDREDDEDKDDGEKSDDIVEEQEGDEGDKGDEEDGDDNVEDREDEEGDKGECDEGDDNVEEQEDQGDEETKARKKFWLDYLDRVLLIQLSSPLNALIADYANWSDWIKSIPKQVYILQKRYHVDCYKRARTEFTIDSVYLNIRQPLKDCIIRNIDELYQEDDRNDIVDNFMTNFYPKIKIKIDNSFLKKITIRIEKECLNRLNEMNDFLDEEISELQGEYTNSPSGFVWSVTRHLLT
jgi:hypothetical protein